MANSDKPAKHILVVDDTEEIVDLFRDIIEGMGHRMTALSFAPDDLADVIKVGPDLVIADVVFGEEQHGWQLIQKMRMSRETEKIPVVICTAATDQVREQEGWLTAKSVKVVLKPFAIDELEHAIHKALSLPDIVA